MPPSEGKQDEPVSLAPLTPDEALRALLAVKPDDEPTEKEQNAGPADKDETGDAAGTGL